MNAVTRLIRENPWTTAMLISSSLLFSAIFFLASSAEHREIQASRLENRPGLSVEELKQKEEAVKRRLEEEPALATALSLGLIALLIAGLWIDIALVNKALHNHPWIAEPASRPEISWGPKQLLQAVVFLFFAEGCLFLGQVGFYVATGIEPREELALMLSSLGRVLMVAAFIVALVIRAGGRPAQDLGLGWKRLGAKIRLGVLAYLAMIPVLLLCLMLLAGIASFFSYEPEPQTVVQMYLKPEMAPYLIFLTLFVAVVGPVLEEMFFRGFAYAGLRRGLGPVKAGVLTAAAFAAFHLSAFAFIPVFALGLFLCYLYERSGSLVPPIAAHVLHNTLMVFFTLGFRSLAGG